MVTSTPAETTAADDADSAVICAWLASCSCCSPACFWDSNKASSVGRASSIISLAARSGLRARKKPRMQACGLLMLPVALPRPASSWPPSSSSLSSLALDFVGRLTTLMPKDDDADRAEAEGMETVPAEDAEVAEEAEALVESRGLMGIAALVAVVVVITAIVVVALCCSCCWC